jgi:hypothetical protein
MSFYVGLPAGHRLHCRREVRHTAVFGFTFKILRGLELRNQADFFGCAIVPAICHWRRAPGRQVSVRSSPSAVGTRMPSPDANADTKLAEPQVACETDQHPPAWRSLMIPTSRLASRHRCTMEPA